MASLFTVIILSIIIMIAAMTVDIKFIYSDSPVISFDFIFFTLKLSSFKKSEKKTERSFSKRFRNGIYGCSRSALSAGI